MSYKWLVILDKIPQSVQETRKLFFGDAKVILNDDDIMLDYNGEIDKCAEVLFNKIQKHPQSFTKEELVKELTIDTDSIPWDAFCDPTYYDLEQECSTEELISLDAVFCRKRINQICEEYSNKYMFLFFFYKGSPENPMEEYTYDMGLTFSKVRCVKFYSRSN